MDFQHKNGMKLRKASENDVPFITQLKKQVFWGMHSNLFVNEEDQYSWFKALDKEILVIGEFNREKIAVGLVSEINQINRSASISGAVIEECRKYGNDFFCAGVDFCFEYLNFERLNAEVISYNYPAYLIDVKNIGFVIEGVKRKSVYKCGQRYDSLVLGLLREEWQNTERVKSYQGSCQSDFDHILANKLSDRLKSKIDLVYT